MPVDTEMTFEEIVIGNGFQVESHFVATTDGFIN